MYKYFIWKVNVPALKVKLKNTCQSIRGKAPSTRRPQSRAAQSCTANPDTPARSTTRRSPSCTCTCWAWVWSPWAWAIWPDPPRSSPPPQWFDSAAQAGCTHTRWYADGHNWHRQCSHAQAPYNKNWLKLKNQTSHLLIITSRCLIRLQSSTTFLVPIIFISTATLCVRKRF